MLRHLVLLFVVFLCGSIIHALPLEVNQVQPTNVDVQKSADSVDDLDSAASSWGGYGIRGWFGPSYYGGSWGGRGHYGHNSWGNRGHQSGGGWGWGNQGHGGGWGRDYGHGSGWHGNRGNGYWW